MLIPREVFLPFVDFLRGLGIEVKVQARCLLGERIAVLREYGTADDAPMLEFHCPDAKQVETIERQWAFHWQKMMQEENEQNELP